MFEHDNNGRDSYKGSGHSAFCLPNSLFSCADICNETSKKEGVADEANADAVGSIRQRRMLAVMSQCFDSIECITSGSTQRVSPDLLK